VKRWPIWLGVVLAILLSGLAVSYLTPKPHRVVLRWVAPAPSPGSRVTGYNIYRSTTSGGPYVKIASLVPGLSYTDGIVSRGRTYFYVVTAVDQEGRESRFSGEIKAVIP
jgi:fibronectin type 3 domain-containing protein